ncbi:hypothetical protein [Oceanobacillus chungangensis]|uniref:Uncharacterized protein n=1 Tax=Oceanobacillus chungangensis TaxID=1229152 RepID=A0A3D8Q2Z5_9BACI|nr:hypothetical protein [Oceanobacillus chungangensis]RDW22118.1 hypothetical protein CWR45_01115 [Oceanobacillus chungangensis]
MSKKAFDIYYLFFLLLLLSFNAFVLFGAGMSGGGIGSKMYFATGLSYAIWGIFYFLQFVWYAPTSLAKFLVPHYGNI